MVLGEKWGEAGRWMEGSGFIREEDGFVSLVLLYYFIRESRSVVVLRDRVG